MKPGDRVRYVGPTSVPTLGGAHDPRPLLSPGVVYTVRSLDGRAPQRLIELVECPRKAFRAESFAPAERRPVQAEGKCPAPQRAPVEVEAQALHLGPSPLSSVSAPSPLPPALAVVAADPLDAMLTVKEVARLARVPRSTIYKLARLQQIPARKIGKHWRFWRPHIERWLREGGCG